MTDTTDKSNNSPYDTQIDQRMSAFIQHSQTAITMLAEQIGLKPQEILPCLAQAAGIIYNRIIVGIHVKSEIQNLKPVIDFDKEIYDNFIYNFGLGRDQDKVNDEISREFYKHLATLEQKLIAKRLKDNPNAIN